MAINIHRFEDHAKYVIGRNFGKKYKDPIHKKLNPTIYNELLFSAKLKNLKSVNQQTKSTQNKNILRLG